MEKFLPADLAHGADLEVALEQAAFTAARTAAQRAALSSPGKDPAWAAEEVQPPRRPLFLPTLPFPFLPAAAGLPADCPFRGPLADSGRPLPACPRKGRPLDALAQHFETQRAGERCGFHQPHLDATAEPICLARRPPDKGMRPFVIVVVIRAQRRGRNEAVGARFVELGRTGPTW